MGADGELDDAVSLDGAAILARVESIDPIIRAHAEEGERARRLATPVVDALRWAGVFRLAMPKAWGGPEVDICTQVRIIERVARADASAGWCAMIGSESGFFASYLEESAARRLYPKLDAVTAGFQGPAGTLHVAEDGYRLSGRWPFGSGACHADVILAGARVIDVDGVPRMTSSGRSEHRVAMLPADQWQVLDTWRPDGLAGSGSHDYAAESLYVPEEYTWCPGQRHRSEPLYSWFGFVVGSGVAPALGAAAAAFETAQEVLTGKTSTALMGPATREPTALAAFARAGAMIGSARSYVYDTLGDLFATAQRGDEPSFAQRAQWAGAVVNTGTTCRDAVQLLVDVAGSAALARSSPLNRRFRDLNVIAQHGLAQRRVWEWAGGLYFGRPAPVPVY